MGLGDLMKVGEKVLGKVSAELMKGEGGKLEKAKLVPDDGSGEISFLFNPETITIKKNMIVTEHPTQATTSGPKEFTSGISYTLTIPEIIFDTYDSKDNVRTTYITKLERLAHVPEAKGTDKSKLPRPPKLLFVWGKFADKTDEINAHQWYLISVETTYILFKEDGTPLRAKVKLELKDADTPEEKGGGGQAAMGLMNNLKVITTKSNDTLQNIANNAYGSPSQWRQIADFNNINDPMNVPPGTKLLIPPKRTSNASPSATKGFGEGLGGIIKKVAKAITKR